MSTTRRVFTHGLALSIALFMFASSSRAFEARDGVVRISAGAGQFEFVDEKGDSTKRMAVYTYLPLRLKADAAPIVFVMHGKGKNAEGYRDVWAKHAKARGFMVVAPLFDDAAWGGSYAGDKVFAQGRTPGDAPRWSFSVIEHLFDAIKAATGNRHATYLLYGHSEGAQFVHRLVWFLPEARFAKAVAANPGWATMPDLAVAFPYGLANSPANEQSLQQSLERKLSILLGERDTDPNHAQLRKTAQAMAQGRHRLERGQNLYRQAKECCAALSCQFGWQLTTVPGAAHSNAQMAGEAAAVLMEGVGAQARSAK